MSTKDTVKDFICEQPDLENKKDKFFSGLVPASAGVALSGTTLLLRLTSEGMLPPLAELAPILHIVQQRAPDLFEWIVWTGPDIGYSMILIGLIVCMTMALEMELVGEIVPFLRSIDYILETANILTVSGALTLLFLLSEFAQLNVHTPDVLFTYKDLFGYLGGGAIAMLTVLAINLRSRLKSWRKSEKQY